MPEHRDGGGRYTERISDRDLLHFFDSGRRDFYGAGEIATEFDIDRSQAHRRLSRLSDDDELKRVKVGNRNVVWWRPRDVVVLVPEEDGYSILDPQTGVASQGETRPEALRMLAEAVEVSEGNSDVSPSEVYAELDLDPDEIPEDAAPPWE